MIYFMNRWQNQNILADDRSKWQLFVYGKGAAINWKWAGSMLDYLSECLLHRWTSRFFRALIISKIACGVFWSSNNSVYFSVEHEDFITLSAHHYSSWNCLLNTFWSHNKIIDHSVSIQMMFVRWTLATVKGLQILILLNHCTSNFILKTVSSTDIPKKS